MASLFTVQTPVVTDASDGGAAGISTATTVRFLVDGTVTGIRFFSTVTIGGTYTAELWHVDSADDPGPGTGTLLASKVMVGAPSSATWNDVTFDTPVAVTTNNLYRATINNSQGRYVATLNFFAAALTNGDIIGDQDSTDPVGLGTLRNGTFEPNSAPGVYPNNASGSTCYFADVLFVTDTLGTAASDLGGLGASATGESISPGVGAGSLGGLGAAASGLVTVSGTASSDLGRLVATASNEVPVIDVILEPLMDEILLCLCEAVATIPNPPQHCCFRIGSEIAHDAGVSEDLCCEGLAYVSLGDIYPSSTSFPEQDIIRQAAASCAPPTWAVAVKLGIVRCVPVGDMFTGPSCEEWNTAARQNIYDSLALRNAACCVRNYITNAQDALFGMSVILERQTQGSPGGGCVERSINMTIQIPNCSC